MTVVAPDLLSRADGMPADTPPSIPGDTTANARIDRWCARVDADPGVAEFDLTGNDTAIMDTDDVSRLRRRGYRDFNHGTSALDARWRRWPSRTRCAALVGKCEPGERRERLLQGMLL